ncbi:glycosyltransferase [Candidatus Sumerlaeota bacterium]|nr:glycosyltransferase [Candidatus Sumerlaeales bacterium]NLD60900.1 glycosyltransferase [Candidatus Sumerlaeota bacterium]
MSEETRKRPDISVVIAFYNRLDLLDRCLQSVLSQELPDGKSFEVIAVDNGSTDGTRERLAEYGDSIRLLDCATRGPSAARNTGIRAAQGDVVVFTDSDAVPEPNWLRNLTEPFGDSQTIGTGGRIEALVWERGVEMWFQMAGMLNQRKCFEGILCFPPYFATANTAWRRETLQAVGGFNEDIWWSEDCDLGWRIREKGGSIVYVDAAVIRHAHRNTIIGFMRQSMGYGEAAVRVFAAHRDKMGARYFIAWDSYAKFLFLPFRCLLTLIFAHNSFQRRAPFYEWLWRAANIYGNLRGSLRYRVLFIA